jgi:hypothetical protein
MVTIADTYITRNECWGRAEQGSQQLQVCLLLRYVGARVVCSLGQGTRSTGLRQRSSHFLPGLPARLPRAPLDPHSGYVQ